MASRTKLFGVQYYDSDGGLDWFASGEFIEWYASQRRKGKSHGEIQESLVDYMWRALTAAMGMGERHMERKGVLVLDAERQEIDETIARMIPPPPDDPPSPPSILNIVIDAVAQAERAAAADPEWNPPSPSVSEPDPAPDAYDGGGGDSSGAGSSGDWSGSND